jgi:hypothetical protein
VAEQKTIAGRAEPIELRDQEFMLDQISPSYDLFFIIECVLQIISSFVPWNEVVEDKEGRMTF